MSPIERRVELCEEKAKEHSSEIHIFREWMREANIHLATLPELKKGVDGINVTIAKMSTNDALQSQSLKSINSINKWILAFLTTCAGGIIIAYAQTKF